MFVNALHANIFMVLFRKGVIVMIKEKMVAFRCSEDLDNAIKAQAIKTNRSKSNLISCAITEYLKLDKTNDCSYMCKFDKESRFSNL